jgi:hypothetical protein
MMSQSTYITGIITWIACCLLIAYIGKDRKIGFITAFLLPFLSGILIFVLLWLIDRWELFMQYSAMHVKAYRFLASFAISLITGYISVKLSPRREE